MNKNKPTLGKSETALFLATKNVNHVNYNDETFIFKEGSQEEILKDYPTIVFTFCEIIGINSEHVVLENINGWMIDILEKLKPRALKTILLDIQSQRYMYSTGYGLSPMRLSHSPAQAIFLSLYGHLQGIQVYDKVGEELNPLINMDESNVKTN